MIKSVAKLLVKGHRIPDHVDHDVRRAVEVKSLLSSNVDVDFSNVKMSTVMLINRLDKAIQEVQEKMMKKQSSGVRGA